MNHLEKEESGKLKQLMREDGFEVLLRYLARHIDALNAEDISGQDAFETLRALHIRQGKVEGLKEFFDKIDKKSFE